MSTLNNATDRTMSPPDAGVAVRMYRLHGLGACFLLAFRAKDGTGRYMLIDCGILAGARNGAARMKAVGEDIAAATANHLHVLVATHEHWDHVAGFQYARHIFDTIQVDEVWLAWTEDPKNPLAKRLREKHINALRALNEAALRLHEARDPRADAIEKVLSLHGEFDAALGVSGTARQFDYLNKKGGSVCYRHPGEPPVILPDVEGIRVHVLGPPEDEVLLSRSNPFKSGSEVYQKTWALDVPTAFRLAARASKDAGTLSADEQLSAVYNRPFAAHQYIAREAAREYEFFQTHYGFTPEDGGPEWRRIENDWLAAAGG